MERRKLGGGIVREHEIRTRVRVHKKRHGTKKHRKMRKNVSISDTERRLTVGKKGCEEIRALMRTANTYSPAFEPIIELLDRTRTELKKAEKAWRDGGGEFTTSYTNKAGAENIVKNPDFAIVEDLRQDVLSISAQLGLTPQGQRRVIGASGKLPSGKSSALAAAMTAAARRAGK